MIDAVVSAAGGYEKVAEYTRFVSEGGKLAMVAGVVGVVASPILGNSWELALGIAGLGLATWQVGNELSKDFRVVDVMIKRHFANHQAWLEREGLANLENVRLTKVPE